MSDVIFINSTLILAKIETVKGDDALPTGAANAILVSDVTWTPLEGDEVERNNIRPFFGDGGSTQVTQYCKLAFSVEATGVAAAGDLPGVEPLLRAAGCSVTVTPGVDARFAPVSSELESATFYVAIGPNLQKVTSGMLNCKLDAPAKGIPKFQFEMWGTYQAATAAALPAVSYAKFQEPFGVNKVNTQLSLLGVQVATTAFSLDFGNVLVKRDGPNLDTVEIADRKSKGSITFDNTPVSVMNWVERARMSARGPFRSSMAPAPPT